MASMEFAEADESHTRVRYSAEVGLTGKLGGLGQPVLKAKSVELGREFAKNLKAAIEQDAAARRQAGAEAEVQA
jgi:carbon monoxide dehydrogenase subunit G